MNVVLKCTTYGIIKQKKWKCLWGCKTSRNMCKPLNVSLHSEFKMGKILNWWKIIRYFTLKLNRIPSNNFNSLIIFHLFQFSNITMCIWRKRLLETVNCCSRLHSYIIANRIIKIYRTFFLENCWKSVRGNTEFIKTEYFVGIRWTEFKFMVNGED